MTLSPCYLARCDYLGCTASESLPYTRTAECRGRLAALGWAVIEHRRVTSGAPRLLYVCPEHAGWRPADACEPSTRDRRAPKREAMAWMLSIALEDLEVRPANPYKPIAAAMGITRVVAADLAESYAERIEHRHRDSKHWQEPWARRLRAAGAIP